MIKRFLVALLLAAFLAPVAGASAATVGFAVNKSAFDVEALPGGSYADEFVVINASDEISLPVRIEPAAWDIAAGLEEGVEFVDIEEALNPIGWLYLVQPGGVRASLRGGYEFTLAPAGEQMLRFEVRPPAGTAAGAYLASLRLQTALPEEYYRQATGPRLSSEVAVLLFINVPFAFDGSSRTDYAADILELGIADSRQPVSGITAVAHPRILGSGGKTIAAKVKNTGMFYFKASGRLRINSWTGRTVKDLPLPGKYLIPGRVRTLEVPLGSGSWISDQFYLGKYTATIMLAYPQTGEEPLFEELSAVFWIIPWQLMLLAAFVFGLLYAAMRRYGRQLRRAGAALVRRPTGRE